ncbi:MAG: hypothetical protein DRN06_02995, partial [Thermoprotei archaeon]
MLFKVYYGEIDSSVNRLDADFERVTVERGHRNRAVLLFTSTTLLEVPRAYQELKVFFRDDLVFGGLVWNVDVNKLEEGLYSVRVDARGWEELLKVKVSGEWENVKVSTFLESVLSQVEPDFEYEARFDPKITHLVAEEEYLDILLSELASEKSARWYVTPSRVLVFEADTYAPTEVVLDEGDIENLRLVSNLRLNQDYVDVNVIPEKGKQIQLWSAIKLSFLPTQFPVKMIRYDYRRGTLRYGLGLGNPGALAALLITPNIRRLETIIEALRRERPKPRYYTGAREPPPMDSDLSENVQLVNNEYYEIHVAGKSETVKIDCPNAVPVTKSTPVGAHWIKWSTQHFTAPNYYGYVVTMGYYVWGAANGGNGTYIVSTASGNSQSKNTGWWGEYEGWILESFKVPHKPNEKITCKYVGFNEWTYCNQYSKEYGPACKITFHPGRDPPGWQLFKAPFNGKVSEVHLKAPKDGKYSVRLYVNGVKKWEKANLEVHANSWMTHEVDADVTFNQGDTIKLEIYSGSDSEGKVLRILYVDNKYDDGYSNLGSDIDMVCGLTFTQIVDRGV